MMAEPRPPATAEGEDRRAAPSPGVSSQVADKLRQAAELLAQQGANPFRVAAYRRAADAIGRQAWDLRDILEREGAGGLVALPCIGRGIAAAIVEMLRTGRWSQLDRLRGTIDPVRVFRTVPGIGPELARRVHDTLAIDTLEALETAAHDGRLESVPGIGPRRAATVRGALQSLLGSTRVIRHAPGGPGVATLLDVDREYRAEAAAGRLRTIAPRRFNPEKKAWLPVLHARRGRWHFTALYSNTARAHQRGHTRDWVVVYFYDADHREGQHTVVTETRGPLAGRRVVRGREAECHALYAGSPRASGPPRETPAGPAPAGGAGAGPGTVTPEPGDPGLVTGRPVVGPSPSPEWPVRGPARTGAAS
jgi:putative hydrolase